MCYIVNAVRKYFERESVEKRFHMQDIIDEKCESEIIETEVTPAEDAPVIEKKVSPFARVRSRVVDGATLVAEKAKEFGELAAEKGSEAGNAAVDAAKVAASSFQASIEESRRNRLKPVYRDELERADYRYPDLIQIVDKDKDRQRYYPDSIGWLDKKNDMNVLHLYYSAVEENELPAVFGPSLLCGLYYSDHVSKLNYVNLGQYFLEAQTARQVELQQIAYDLGAKYYSVETIEEESAATAHSVKAKTVGTKGAGKTKEGGGAEYSESSTKTEKQHSKIATGVSFDKGVEPVMPKLAWFKNDKQIKQLIDMRLAKNRPMSSYELKFEYSSMAAMSVEMASKIDGVVATMKAQVGYSIKEKLVKENKKKLLFYIEF